MGDERLRDAIGKICTRTLRDAGGRKIVGEGEVVTNDVVQQAMAAGLQDELLASTGATTSHPARAMEESPRPEREQATKKPPLPPAAREIIEEEESAQHA